MNAKRKEEKKNETTKTCHLSNNSDSNMITVKHDSFSQRFYHRRHIVIINISIVRSLARTRVRALSLPCQIFIWVGKEDEKYEKIKIKYKAHKMQENCTAKKWYKSRIVDNNVRYINVKIRKSINVKAPLFFGACEKSRSEMPWTKRNILALAVVVLPFFFRFFCPFGIVCTLFLSLFLTLCHAFTHTHTHTHTHTFSSVCLENNNNNN